jgi:hypothetical protein
LISQYDFGVRHQIRIDKLSDSMPVCSWFCSCVSSNNPAGNPADNPAGNPADNPAKRYGHYPLKVNKTRLK